MFTDVIRSHVLHTLGNKRESRVSTSRINVLLGVVLLFLEIGYR